MTNPYAAPTPDVGAPSGGQNFKGEMEASTGQRFANLLVDDVVSMILNTLSGVVLGIVFGVLGMQDVPQLFVFFVGILVGFGYYAVCEATFGRTVGKLVTGTRVIHVNGGSASFGQILKRTAIRFIPFEAFSFLGSTHGWHDRWSDTRVIRTR